MRQLRNSRIRARLKYIFAKNEHQLLPDLTEKTFYYFRQAAS